LEKKFPDLSIKTPTSIIIELPAENLSPIEVDPLIATAPRKWVDNGNYAVFLRSNNRYELDGYTLGN